jgi:hypothetical protein
MRRRVRGILRVAAPVLLLAALTAPDAGASIRVVDDEVYFTLVAPGAKQVFLVGDFNNWNATVEKMEQTGDTFEMSLYLVEGTYRYKFVVDGNWIADPDNPGDDPARGSLLVLVEKPAGLVLREEDPEAPAARPAVRPAFRYIGQLRWNRPDGEDFADDHYLDFGLVVEREKLRGEVVVRTYNELWDGGQAAVTLDGAYVGTDVAGLGVDAFENHHVVWDSSDPLSLVGDLGPYGYNAGYSRKGAVARYKFLDAIQLNALYADHTGQERGVWPVSPFIEDAGPGGAREAGPAYVWDRDPADSDMSAVEALVDSRKYAFGVVARSNRGMNPGVRTEPVEADSTALVYDTRENTGTSVYWLRLKKLFGVGLVAGYGRGSADVHLLSQQPWRELPDGTLVPDGETTPVDEEIRFEKSDRYTAGLDLRAAGFVTAAAGWDRTEFRFEGALYDGAEAVVDRVSLWANVDRGWWWTGLDARYTRQDYGDTPDGLLVDSPVRNMWLDWRDKFDVPDIVGIDTDSYTDVSLFVQWFAQAGDGEAEVGDEKGDAEEAPPVPAWVAARQTTRQPFPGDPEPGVRLELGATTDGFLRSSQYARARVQAAWLYRDRWYALADGRYAVYDKPGWGERQSFVCGYVEAGYRHRWLGVNLGWGMDPVVFDGTLSRFHDYGRTELLRQSIEDGVRRGTSDEIGGKLLQLERQLRDTQTIKLELMVTF